MKRMFCVVAAGLGCTLAIVMPAHHAAAKIRESIVYSFGGGADGARPQGGLLLDKKGVLYGTTSNGCGTVFQLGLDGLRTVYTFHCTPDGGGPIGGLTRDASGNLFGATNGGGAYDAGAVFKVGSDGTEIVLYSFTGGLDGAGPQGGVILDSKGNLFGTTYFGGTNNLGTFYRLTPDGKHRVLKSFGSDTGYNPDTDLITAHGGNFYGATQGGNIYQATPDGQITITYSIGDAARLTKDGAGNMYTTTYQSGIYGLGAVYKFPRHGFEVRLYSFQGGSDGYYPYGNVAIDTAGNIYGTTWKGGKFDLGTVFRVRPNGRHTILHSFKGGTDGAYPITDVVMDADGNIYGTTTYGGDHSFGTVFKVTTQ